MEKIIFSLFAFCICTALSYAQEINVTQAQLLAKASFAQPFNGQYHISHTPDYTVTVDKDSLSKDFEITQSALTRQSPGTASYDFTAIPFTLGKSTFTVTFVLTQNDKTVAQNEQSVPIEITPVKIFNDKKLREIRPARVPAGWLTWLIVLFLIVALIYVIYYWIQRAKESPLRLKTEKEDTRPCDEIALSKIDLLLNSGLWERKEYKLFYITLCDILREYFWRQFHIDTSADTSVELLRRAKNVSALQPLLATLKDFLNSGDLVKFAKAEPTEPIRNKDIQSVRQIVQETTPKPSINGEEKKQ